MAQPNSSPPEPPSHAYPFSLIRMQSLRFLSPGAAAPHPLLLAQRRRPSWSCSSLIRMQIWSCSMEDQRRRGNSSPPAAAPRADGKRGRWRLGSSSFSRRRGRTRPLWRRRAGSVLPASSHLLSDFSTLLSAGPIRQQIRIENLSFKAHCDPVRRYAMDTYPQYPIRIGYRIRGLLDVSG